METEGRGNDGSPYPRQTYRRPVTFSSPVDNVCQMVPGLCRNGKCINIAGFGKYRCMCDVGFKLDPSGKRCLGKREEDAPSPINFNRDSDVNPNTCCPKDNSSETWSHSTDRLFCL